MKTKTGEPKTRHRHLGIRWSLFLFLGSFTILILLVIWIFQIRLLGYFYEREKFSELKDTAAELSAVVGTEDLVQKVADISSEKKICIRVFAIENQMATQIADADVNADCVIHHLRGEALSELYDNAVKNGGAYDKRLEFSRDSSAEAGGFHLPGIRPLSNTVNAVYVLVTDAPNGQYLLILDSELSPVQAAVNTLQVQFLWISISLLLVAALFAFLLSHMVAKPLTDITSKAEKLAAGNFQENFRGGCYREVEKLADTLNFAAREIGATDRLQKELIANISHDLRTPLTMIKGYSELMRDLPGENNAENAQIIIDETTRLSELVSDLLDLSKLQAGTKKPEMTVFDLGQLLRETMKRYDALIRHDGYHIDLEANDPAPVLADRTMILQVIYNLINNAVNYTGDSLRVRVTETLTDTPDGKTVRVSVTDDGNGIPKELIPQIWDRYYRVDKIHKRAIMGTGLGLSIVKGILEAHHAKYGVDSAVGVGSVFWFELPLAEEDLPRLPSEDESEHDG